MKHIIFFIIIFLLTSCKSKKEIYGPASKKSDSLTLRSNYFFETNNLDSAKYYINEALILDSTNWGAYNNRAILKFKEGEPTIEVIADFETSLRLSPGYETALYSLANYYDEIRDYKKVINACNRYDFQKNKIDSVHIKEINRLNLKAQHYEKMIGNISIFQAGSFYDSVNLILENADSLQQRFINELKAITKSIIDNKNSYCDFNYLNRQYDSLLIFRKNEFAEISKIQEIDSSINYKGNVLNYLSIIMTTYESSFSRMFYCIKTKDIILIKNCLTSMNPFSLKLAKAKNDLKQLRHNYEKKYEL